MTKPAERHEGDFHAWAREAASLPGTDPYDLAAILGHGWHPAGRHEIADEPRQQQEEGAGRAGQVHLSGADGRRISP